MTPMFTLSEVFADIQEPTELEKSCHFSLDNKAAQA